MFEVIYRSNGQSRREEKVAWSDARYTEAGKCPSGRRRSEKDVPVPIYRYIDIYVSYGKRYKAVV